MKIWLSSGLAVTLLVFTAACGGQSSDNPGNSQASANISPQASAGATETTATGQPVKSPPPEETVRFPEQFKKRDKLVFPGLFEISMVSAEFTTKVEPSKPSELYNYYEVKDPNRVYAHSVFSIKNLSGSALDADSVLTLIAKYDGQYDYKGFSAIEEVGGGDLTYPNIVSIAPLSTRTLHYLIEVPKEVRDSGKPLVYSLKADGKILTTDAATEGGETLVAAKDRQLKERKERQSYDQWKLNEPQTVEGYAEITLDLAELTTKVKPPKPGTFYTFYEVKDPNLTYAHLALSFKNTMNIGKDADEALKISLIYDNKYEYRPFEAVEEQGGTGFTYSNITRIEPLLSEKLHYMFEIPAEAAQNKLDLVFVIQANDKKVYFQLPR